MFVCVGPAGAGSHAAAAVLVEVGEAAGAPPAGPGR